MTTAKMAEHLPSINCHVSDAIHGEHNLFIETLERLKSRPSNECHVLAVEFFLFFICSSANSLTCQITNEVDIFNDLNLICAE